MSNLDFISRSELLAEIDQERKRHIDSGNYGAEHLMVHSLRRLVEDAPAVDAAPVVRCKDCKHYSDGICEQIEYIMDGYYRDTFEVKRPDDFCSYGAKMDKEADNAQK